MKEAQNNLVFFKPNDQSYKDMPLAHTGVSAGFPSPADDFKELRISIDQEVVKNEEATFLCKGRWTIHAGGGIR